MGAIKRITHDLPAERNCLRVQAIGGFQVTKLLMELGQVGHRDQRRRMFDREQLGLQRDASS